LRDYVEYQLKKYGKEEEKSGKYKKANRKNVVKDWVRYKIDEFAGESALTAD